MCRWLAYYGKPVLMDKVLYGPQHSLIEQSLESRMGAEPTNGDGFGIGWYSQYGPGTFKSMEPAWNDRNLRQLAGHVESHLFVAHVRATTGTPVQQTNCHPFGHGKWLLAHNGVVSDWLQVKRDLVLAVDPELYPFIEGTTDSEVLFFLALTLGLEEDPPAAIARTLGMVEEVGHQHDVEFPFQGTIVTTNGERLWAFRYSSEGSRARSSTRARTRRSRSSTPTTRASPCSTRRRGWSSPSHSAIWLASGTRCPRRATGSSNPARTSCTRSNRWYPRTSHSRTGAEDDMLLSLGEADPPADHELFVERARAVGRDIEADATVEAVCKRLDNLPLAIELAAARVRLLAPGALLARLERALPLLTGGSRDAPERQRTLQATIEWSYDLLDDEGRRLLARLAVFAGIFRIETAESVCEGQVSELSALVDLSLLKPIDGDRLLMLETIRDYGLERLAESGEEETFRTRHAAEFARLAEAAYQLRDQAEAEWSSRLDRDHDDLRAALDWLSKTDPDAAVELAGALGWFWFARGYLVEGDARLRAALDASAANGRVRARALAASGSLAARIGMVDEGRLRLEEAVTRWKELGDQEETAAALEALGWLFFYDAGQNEVALAAFEEARSIRHALGDRAGETRALVGVCQVLVALDDERAEPLAHELLERGEDDVRTRHFAIHFLADCALLRGDCAEAEVRYRQSLRDALDLGDVIETSVEVQGVAMAKAGQGESALGIELAAAVEALWRSLGTDLHVDFWDRLLERYLGNARTALGQAAETARTRGLELPFDDAVDRALQDGPGGSDVVATASGP